MDVQAKLWNRQNPVGESMFPLSGQLRYSLGKDSG